MSEPTKAMNLDRVLGQGWNEKLDGSLYEKPSPMHAPQPAPETPALSLVVSGIYRPTVEDFGHRASIDLANDISVQVAINLTRLRKYRRWSQAQVAEAMGTSQSAVARIESGEENITLGTFRRHVMALRGRCILDTPPEEMATPPLDPWWVLLALEPVIAKAELERNVLETGRESLAGSLAAAEERATALREHLNAIVQHLFPDADDAAFPCPLPECPVCKAKKLLARDPHEGETT